MIRKTKTGEPRGEEKQKTGRHSRNGGRKGEEDAEFVQNAAEDL